MIAPETQTRSQSTQSRSHTSHTTHTQPQTFRELRATAEAQGIEGWSKMGKAELQQALEVQK